MNYFELNAVLYYADFLSLLETSLPVTDNCKYFFVFGVPINSLFLLDLTPFYSEENRYFILAYQEYKIIKDKFGEDGVSSFVNDICSIKACGSVDATQMLKCIHKFSSKRDRKAAFNTYKKWKESLKYTHTIINDDGDPEEKECSSYIAHTERLLGRSKLVENVQNN